MERVLLKLSGEALAGEKKTGFDEGIVAEVARQIKEVTGGISGEEGRAGPSTGQKQTRSG